MGMTKWHKLARDRKEWRKIILEAKGHNGRRPAYIVSQDNIPQQWEESTIHYRDKWRRNICVRFTLSQSYACSCKQVCQNAL
jgi:hypothetical protein